jgi:multiple sugar transport system permease protein
MDAKPVRSNVFFVIISIVCLLYLVPFFFMLLTAVKTLPEIMSSKFIFFPKKVMFSNFVDAMHRGNWLRYLTNSLVITVLTVFISLVVNSTAGYAFARIPFKFRNTLFLFALTGMMVPSQVTMIAVFIILRNIPFVGGNNFFGQGGTGLINTYAGLVLPYVASPFGVFLCRQFYMNFPNSLDDAAKIDGCSRFRAFVFLYIPLSKPIFATLALLKGSNTWNDFIWPLIMVGTDNMMTAQVAVVTKFVSELTIQWHLLMAATTIIIIPLVILFLLTQKYYVEGIITTGIKG